MDSLLLETTCVSTFRLSYSVLLAFGIAAVISRSSSGEGFQITALGSTGSFFCAMTGAAASGILAGYVALVYVSEEPAPLQAATPSRTIVVAARDLPAGTIVSREDVETVAWPGSAVPEGIAQQAGEVVGRGLIVEVRPSARTARRRSINA